MCCTAESMQLRIARSIGVFDQPPRPSGRAMDGTFAVRPTLAVIRAGILSAREGRRVEVAEILSED